MGLASSDGSYNLTGPNPFSQDGPLDYVSEPVTVVGHMYLHCIPINPLFETSVEVPEPQMERGKR